MINKHRLDLFQINCQQLKKMRDQLKQCKKRIEIKLDNEREIARELVKNGKIE